MSRRFPALLAGVTAPDPALPKHTHVSGDLVDGFDQLDLMRLKVRVLEIATSPAEGEVGGLVAYKSSGRWALEVASGYGTGYGEIASITLYSGQTQEDQQIDAAGQFWPDTTNLFDLGTGTKQWRTLHSQNFGYQGLRYPWAVAAGKLTLTGVTVPATARALTFHAPQATPVVT